MSKLNRVDKRVIAEKFMELGNIIMGGIALESLLSHQFNFERALLILLLLIATYIFSIIYLKG